MTWPQINEKLSYLLHLSFFSPPHNSLLVSVKNIPRCSLATPLYEVYQWKTWETDFAPSLKVLFKVQVAKLLQRIEANVSDTGDMQRRGKSRAALSLQLNVTKNTGLTKLSIAAPAFKLQQPQRKQPSGPILLCEPWHVQQGYFVFCLSLLTDKKYDSCHWELGQDIVWSSTCNSSCTVNPTQRIRLFTWWFIPKQTNIRAS